MSMSAQQVYPEVSGTVSPDADGLRRELWRVTGDGSATSVTITPSTIRLIVAAYGGGMSTNNLTPPTAGYVSGATTVTLTWGTAVGNGLHQDVVLEGLA